MTPRLNNTLAPVEILLVEDSPTDRLIAIEALTQARLINGINVVENGVDALAYLRREGQFENARRPQLILLDLNLPKKDGRDVLAEIKRDAALKLIPVIVLTTSKADEDVLCAYGLHANSYITKPVDFARFTEALRALGNYWFEVVTLPPHAALENLVHSTTARPSSPGWDPERPLRVLLLEDSEVDALLFREALADAQATRFELIHIDRFDALVPTLARGRFDVIVTDLGLGRSQGLDTFRRVRAAAPALAIVVSTGLDEEKTALLALREGADDYLVKGQVSGSTVARSLRYAIERRSIQERLRQAQRMEAIGQLAGGVAHDFNNILTIVHGYAELLDEHSSPAEVIESAREIQAAASRARQLTRQLLTFSQRQMMRFEALDLNSIVGGFTKMLRRVVGSEMRLDLRLAAEAPVILADVGMVEQVLLNLALNARDAMPSNGRLTLETGTVDIDDATAREHPDAKAGRFAVLRVSDTGGGIPEDLLGRIWEPFFTTKPTGKGTGLGLATVYGIARQHRGWVEVRSQLGAGTTFEVFLPFAETECGSARIETIAPAELHGSETILLVEDEASIRHLAATTLAKQGYSVLEAGSGPEALALGKARGHEIDLVLTDMVMPDGMTGRQVASAMGELCPRAKVIFTSGYSPDLVKGDVVLTDGYNFLQKPYELHRLCSLVRRVLDGEERSPSCSAA